MFAPPLPSPKNDARVPASNKTELNFELLLEKDTQVIKAQQDNLFKVLQLVSNYKRNEYKFLCDYLDKLDLQQEDLNLLLENHFEQDTGMDKKIIFENLYRMPEFHFNKPQRDKLRQLKLSLANLEIIKVKEYQDVKDKIKSIREEFKLKAWEKALRIALAGYSGIGFAGGISGTILLFVPAGKLAESLIRGIVALISLVLEYSDKFTQSANEDDDLKQKLNKLDLTRRQMALQESEKRLESYPILRKILAHKWAKGSEAKRARKFNPTLKDLNAEFELQLKNLKKDSPSGIKEAHQEIERKHPMYKVYSILAAFSSPFRTFLGGTLTLFGLANTIAVLVGVATLPFLGFCLIGAAVLNVGVGYLFHLFNKRSERQKAKFKVAYDKLYNDTHAHLEQVGKLPAHLTISLEDLRHEARESAKLKNKPSPDKLQTKGQIQPLSPTNSPSQSSIFDSSSAFFTNDRSLADGSPCSPLKVLDSEKQRSRTSSPSI